MINNSRQFTVSRCGPKMSLKEKFDQFFSLVPAETPDLLRVAYRLRYQVYCKENVFETAEDFLDGCEIDEYDERSVHMLLQENTCSTYIGTVRIILPLRYAPERSFPIQKICYHSRLAGAKINNAAEISRFAISKAARQAVFAFASTDQRQGTTFEQLSAQNVFIPFMALGLIKGIFQLSKEHQIHDLYAVMEPSLLRLLSSFGIYFKPIGPIVDYHGMRQPCHVHLRTLLERVYKERPDVWEFVTDKGMLLKDHPIPAQLSSCSEP